MYKYSFDIYSSVYYLAYSTSNLSVCNINQVIAKIFYLKDKILIFTFNKFIYYKFVKKLFIILERIFFCEPVEYALSSCNFFSYYFYVNKSVLIPRKETEFIVNYVLNNFRLKCNMSILDLATGSASIITTLSLYYQYLENLFFLGRDNSYFALKVASKNVKLHHQFKYNKKILLDCNSLFSGLRNLQCNLIVCNPPYISYTEFTNLPQSSLSYEPNSALLARCNGVEFYKKIAKKAHNYMARNGELVLEIPWNKTFDIIRIFLKEGYTKKVLLQDYSSLDRVLVFSYN